MALGPISGGFGDAIFDPESVYGSKPKVPVFKPIDLADEQQAALKNNEAILPGAEKFTDQTNQFTRDQINKMMRSVFPTWDSSIGLIGANIESFLKGDLSDIGDEVMRHSAARALEGGFSGSGMGDNLTARDLGLTSLGLKERGLSMAESWAQNVNRLFEPHMMDVRGMFVSPEQQANWDKGERDTQFQHDWLVNQIKAMPDPVAAGGLNTMMNMLAAVRGSPAPAQVGGQTPQYGGGGGYPQTYGPGGWSTAPNEGYGGYDADSVSGDYMG